MTGWAAQTVTGDWDDLSISQLEISWPQLVALRSRLSVDEVREFAADDADRMCFYRRALAGISSADIVVANHAVLVTLGRLVEEVPHVIVDEGHNLEDAATSALTETTGGAALAALFDCVAHVDSGAGVLRRYSVAATGEVSREQIAAARDALSQCREALTDLDRRIVDYIRGRTEVTVEAAVSFGVAYRLRPGLDTSRAEFAPARRAARALSEYLRRLSGCMAFEPPAAALGSVRWRHIESELGCIGRRVRTAAGSARQHHVRTRRQQLDQHCRSPLSQTRLRRQDNLGVVDAAGAGVRCRPLALQVGRTGFGRADLGHSARRRRVLLRARADRVVRCAATRLAYTVRESLTE